MSWRFLFAILVVAAGASAWGGVRLGDWMVSHAPQANANATVNQGDDWSDKPRLDANGRPYVAQPPQPRVDGSLGVPETPPAQDWSTLPPSLFADTPPDVQVSRGAVTQAQAQAAAAINNAGLPAGASDVVTLDLGAAPAQNSASNLPPPSNVNLDHQPAVVAQSTFPASPAAAASGNWQNNLRHEIEQCSNLGFFQRPTCVWNARNKYCSPNNGWGNISDCPKRVGD